MPTLWPDMWQSFMGVLPLSFKSYSHGYVKFSYKPINHIMPLNVRSSVCLSVCLSSGLHGLLIRKPQSCERFPWQQELPIFSSVCLKSITGGENCLKKMTHILHITAWALIYLFTVNASMHTRSVTERTAAYYVANIAFTRESSYCFSAS